MEQPKPKPFVKWVGGKRGILKELISRLPETYDRYFEPFVGGGALLFELQPKQAFISDANEELILAYQTVRDHPEKLMRALDEHKSNHSEEYYYKIRGEVPEKDIERTARFIYLNKACFNGVYRLNKSGEFNVPSGKRSAEKLSLYDSDNLLLVSSFLQNVSIGVFSFEKIKPQKGDFVYLAPPYHNGYSDYTVNKFNCDDHILLAKFTHKLIDEGVKIMQSNSNTPLIRLLYKDLNVTLIETPMSVNSKGDGRKGHELLITSY